IQSPSQGAGEVAVAGAGAAMGPPILALLVLNAMIYLAWLAKGPGSRGKRVAVTVTVAVVYLFLLSFVTGDELAAAGWWDVATLLVIVYPIGRLFVPAALGTRMGGS